MDFDAILKSAAKLVIRQRRELTELVGFETRNKYSIENEDGLLCGYCAEQQKGVLGFLMRQFLGHWRSFELFFFDSARQQTLRAVHPFRWYFQRLEVFTPDNRKLGAIQLRFALLHKKFDVENELGAVVMTVSSPIWKIWTFPFIKQGREAAVVRKKWGGVLKEAFLDADSFGIEFNDAELPLEQKKVLLAATIFIDLQYFEKKSS